jgi:hypothetical protein
MKDKLDNDILECQKYRSQFVKGRERLDATMEQIFAGTYKKDIPIAPTTYSATASRNIADYKRSASERSSSK